MVERLTRQNVVLALLFLVFIAIAIVNLFSRGIWTDEAYTMSLLSGTVHPSFPAGIFQAAPFQDFLTRSASTAGVWNAILQQDTHPPAYFLLSHFWSLIFGQSLISLRFLSLILAVFALWGFYEIMKKYVPSMALGGLAILIFSSGFVHYATEARAYMFSLTLFIWFVVFLFRSEDVTGRKAAVFAVLSGLCAAGSFLGHYVMMVPIAVVYLYALVMRRDWYQVIASGVVASLIVLAWVPVFLEYHYGVREDLGGFKGWTTAISDAIRNVKHAFYIPVDADYPNTVHRLGLLFFLFLILAGLTAARKRENRKAVLLFVAILGGSLMGVVILNFLFDKHLSAARYVLTAITGIAGLAALGLMQLEQWKKWTGYSAAAIGCGFLISVLGFGHSNSDYLSKTIYPAILAEVTKQSEGRDLVVVGRAGMRPVGAGNTLSVLYILPPDMDFIALTRDHSAKKVVELAEGYERVWLIQQGEWTKEQETALSQLNMGARTAVKHIGHVTLYQ